MENTGALLSVIASQRQRSPNGTFLDGKILSAEQKREKNRLRQARWNAANPEKRLAIAAKERAKNRSRYNEWNSTHIEHKYNHKQAALRRQAGRPKPQVCEVPGCGRSDQIHFDHCHKSNRFRGWICQGCNKALGYVKDDPERLRRLAEYLEASRVEQ